MKGENGTQVFPRTPPQPKYTLLTSPPRIQNIKRQTIPLLTPSQLLPLPTQFPTQFKQTPQTNETSFPSQTQTIYNPPYLNPEWQDQKHNKSSFKPIKPRPTNPFPPQLKPSQNKQNPTPTKQPHKHQPKKAKSRNKLVKSHSSLPPDFTLQIPTPPTPNTTNKNNEPNQIKLLTPQTMFISSTDSATTPRTNNTSKNKQPHPEHQQKNEQSTIQSQPFPPSSIYDSNPSNLTSTSSRSSNEKTFKKPPKIFQLGTYITTSAAQLSRHFQVWKIFKKHSQVDTESETNSTPHGEQSKEH